MLNPVGILKNTSTGLFHPIVFRIAPLASRADEDSGALRHRSRGHLTVGLGSLELAQAWIAARENSVDCGTIWEWDGKGIPVIVLWFPKSILESTPEPAVA